jgi:hypothetical protein
MNDPQPNTLPQNQPLNREKRPSQHLHETKTTFLIVITMVFALLSLVSLFFVLKMRRDSQTTQASQQEMTQVTQNNEDKMQPQSVAKPDDQLNLKEEIFDLDKLNLDKIPNNYTGDLLN